MAPSTLSSASHRSARDILVVCPQCVLLGTHTELGRLDELKSLANGSVDCPTCRSTFGVRNGIPILVPAELLSPYSSADAAADEEHAVFDTQATRKVARLVAGLSGQVSLDVGCGKGPYTRYYDGDVVLADLNFMFVEEAVSRYSGEHDVYGVVADARALPFAPRSFDHVVCSSTLEHLDPEGVVRALGSIKELSAGTAQVDVPNDSGVFSFLRQLVVKSGLFRVERFDDPALMHHAPLGPRDLRSMGFEVHGCVHWVSRERIKLGALWDLYDLMAWNFPAAGSTLVGLYSRTAPLGSAQQDMKMLWDGIGDSYENRWRTPASLALSETELGFIGRSLREVPGGRFLDMGVGTGRILDHLLRSDRSQSVYGLDLSDEMIAGCARRTDDSKLQELRACDISAEDIPFDGDFDLITAVRVLPYCRNWKEVLGRAVSRLSPGGIIVFSMPNRRSINRLTPCPVPVERATKQEIERLAMDLGTELLSMEAFTRLPDVLYDAADSYSRARYLLAAERVLGRLLGKTLFGRFLFVALRKHP